MPVGAVLPTPDGTVLAADGNRVRALSDPTAHAELLVIRAGAAALGSERLAGCGLTVTLEPRPMCAGAISLTRIGRLWYGAPDRKGGGSSTGSASSRTRPATTGPRSTAASPRPPAPRC